MFMDFFNFFFCYVINIRLGVREIKIKWAKIYLLIGYSVVLLEEFRGDVIRYYYVYSVVVMR